MPRNGYKWVNSMLVRQTTRYCITCRAEIESDQYMTQTGRCVPCKGRRKRLRQWCTRCGEQTEPYNLTMSGQCPECLDNQMNTVEQIGARQANFRLTANARRKDFTTSSPTRTLEQEERRAAHRASKKQKKSTTYSDFIGQLEVAAQAIFQHDGAQRDDLLRTAHQKMRLDDFDLTILADLFNDIPVG